MRQPVPFGKYLLLDRISVGGMAEVFKAKSYGVEGFEKIIAIKRILPTMGEDRDFIKMFIDEAKIAGQLAHANICQIFELGRIDGSHFIAMEYIWGKDLLQIQNRVRKLKQQLPVPMACFMIAKVLEGLDYAHRKRDPLGRPLEIVHRDCSPQNVLVSYEGEVKVIDFGIAKATSRNSRTMAGVLKGKFGYMSPEQVRGLPLDRRSDIFALGTMLYECLTGDRLFQGETDFSTLEKVRNVDVRPPREVNPKIPEAVERVIMKALAKDTEDRYQWCSEMLADLQQFLMGQDVVFTAKSLAGWLKEVFQPEIEKERALLEQYKRVGRDGLIAGVPAAEAKLDVVENLGEAGAPEGDATQLGGPSFDMEEQQVAAAPVVEAPPPAPAPRAPSQANPGIARINGKQPNAARAAAAAAPAPAPRPQPAVPDDEFGEEQPTEIFGDSSAEPPTENAMASPARTQTPNKPMPRQPAPQMQAPLQPMQRPANNPNAATMVAGTPVGQPQPMMGNAASGHSSGLAPAGRNANAATMLAGTPVGQPQVQLGAAGYYPPQGPQEQMPVAPPEVLGPAGASPMPMQPMGQPLNAIPLGAAGAPQNPAARTLLGQPAPNLDQYRQQQPPPQQQFQQPPPQQQYPSYPQNGYPQAQPQNGYPQQQTPQSYPGMQQQPGYPMQSQNMGYPMAPPGSPYASGQQPSMPEAVVPVEGQKKKSSLGRDIAIGVVIAALVLGGFLIVKFFVLDNGNGDSSTTSTMATIRVQMSPGVTAELDIDGKKIGIVNNKDEIPVSGSADKRKVKLLGPGGQKCESEMKLPAGETTTLECPMTPVATPSSSGSGSAGSAGSAAAVTSPAGGTAGSATPTVATNVGSGSAVAKQPDPVKPPDTTVKPPDTTVKPPDTTKKPPDVVAVKPPDTHPDTSKKPPDTTTHVDTTKKPPDTTHHDKMPEETSKSGDGYLEITSKPRAKISIDGNDTGLTTPISGKALKLAPGKHKVTFYAGDDKFTFSVIVKPGETLRLDKVLQ